MKFVIRLIFGCFFSVLFLPFFFNAEQKPLAGRIIAINAGHNAAQHCCSLRNGDGIGAHSIIGREKMRYPANPIAIKQGKYMGVIREADLTLDIANRLAKKIQQLGGRAVLTRVEPCSPTYAGRRNNLMRRAQIANRSRADVLIDLHANNNQPSSRGYMLFVPFPGKEKGTFRYGSLPTLKSFVYKNRRFRESVFLADCMHKELLKLSRSGGIPPYVRKPIYACGFKVIGYAKMVAVLIEVGFMDRKVDMDLLARSNYRDHLAGALALAVLRWFNTGKNISRQKKGRRAY